MKPSQVTLNKLVGWKIGITISLSSSSLSILSKIFSAVLRITERVFDILLFFKIEECFRLFDDWIMWLLSLIN